MGDRWRIMVVDDDQDVLDLIRLKLTDAYDVLCVDEAGEVSQAADLFEPDLIVLDIMMPKISGYQVLEYLKRNPATSKTPVCFLSAKASARDLKYGYRLGADLYLTKPFQPERLIKNIKLLFDRTPPARKPKRYTVAQINERLSMTGAYQVATGEAETVAREAEKHARQVPLSEAPTPEQIEKQREDRESRGRHWVD